MARSESLTLAIVDDDDDVRVALARLLRSLGHEVRLFASAEEFEAEVVVADCLILDVRLPGLSGLDLRDRMRYRVSAIPVVLITGDSDWLARDAAVDTPSVTKPFDDVTLMAAIANAMASVETEGERYAD